MVVDQLGLAAVVAAAVAAVVAAVVEMSAKLIGLFFDHSIF